MSQSIILANYFRLSIIRFKVLILLAEPILNGIIIGGAVCIHDTLVQNNG